MISAALVAGAVAVGLAALALYFDVHRSFKSEAPSSTLETRLQEVADSMQQSARMLAEVEIEIQARADRAKALQEEVENAQRLAELSRRERDAVAALVRSEITNESKRASRGQLIANILFFAAGVAASIAVTLFVHPLQ